MFEDQKNTRLAAKLSRSCLDIMRTINRDPSVRVLDISVRAVATSRFESANEQVCYIVEVKTNNATMLRGSVDAFKGSYKERVEAVLDFIVKRVEPGSSAHLEIVGPSPLSVERSITIAKLLKAGKLRDNSPLVETARAYGLRYALIRGRHFVGPSPAIAKVLEQLVGFEGYRPESVADLFAGSGIASVVVSRYASPKRFLVIEKDPAKIRRLRRHLMKSRARFVAADACRVKLPRQPFDLAIADPYYEDARLFLRYQLGWIARYAKRFLMVSGGVEHQQWNRAIERALRSAGLRPKMHLAFGQVILESRISR